MTTRKATARATATALEARLSQGGKQVFPRWVRALDQFDLLSASPFLELFFTRDGGPDVHEVFEIDEAVNGVARCECRGWIRGAWIHG